MLGQRQAMGTEPWVALGGELSPVGSLNGGDHLSGVACERVPASDAGEGPGLCVPEDGSHLAPGA